MNEQELKDKIDSLNSSIIDISNEAFRFKRVFMRAISKLDSESQAKYASQFAWFSKRVDKAVENAGLRIVDLTGQPFDPGMAVTPLNIEDFDTDDQLYIEQMMEPIIMLGRIEI